MAASVSGSDIESVHGETEHRACPCRSFFKKMGCAIDNVFHKLGHMINHAFHRTKDFFSSIFKTAINLTTREQAEKAAKTECELLQDFYEAVNSGESEAILAAFDPLADSTKAMIYKEVWKANGSPENAEENYGELIFNANPANGELCARFIGFLPLLQKQVAKQEERKKELEPFDHFVASVENSENTAVKTVIDAFNNLPPELQKKLDSAVYAIKGEEDNEAAGMSIESIEKKDTKTLLEAVKLAKSI